MYQEKKRVPTLGIDPLYGKVKFVLNAFIKIMGKILKNYFLFNPLNQNHYTC